MLTADFARPESYTGALSQYTEYPKIYILYYQLKMAGLPVQLFHFPYAASRESL